MRFLLKGPLIEEWEEPSEEDLDPESVAIVDTDEEEDER